MTDIAYWPQLLGKYLLSALAIPITNALQFHNVQSDDWFTSENLIDTCLTFLHICFNRKVCFRNIVGTNNIKGWLKIYLKTSQKKKQKKKQVCTSMLLASIWLFLGLFRESRFNNYHHFIVCWDPLHWSYCKYIFRQESFNNGHNDYWNHYNFVWKVATTDALSLTRGDDAVMSMDCHCSLLEEI